MAIKVLSGIDLSSKSDSIFDLLPKDLAKDISITAEGKNILYIVYSNDNVNFDKTSKKLLALLNVWAKSKKAIVKIDESDSDIGLIVFRVYVEFNKLDKQDLNKLDVKTEG